MLNFRKVLGSQKSCKGSTEFPYSLHPSIGLGKWLRQSLRINMIISFLLSSNDTIQVRESILKKTWTCRTNVSFHPLEIRKTALHGRGLGRSSLFEERSEKLKVNTGSSMLFLICKPSPSRSIRQLYTRLLLCTRLWRYQGSKSKSTLHWSEKLSIRKGNSVGLCKSREGKVFQKMKGENQVSVP